tara:strand:+ start:85 stop:309 length:225 start_codon:yes stop_codon:yes gene_type:complete
MKIETRYTTGPVKHIHVWNNLEITCEDDSTIIVELSLANMKELADKLRKRWTADRERELEQLKEALDPTEQVEE